MIDHIDQTKNKLLHRDLVECIPVYDVKELLLKSSNIMFGDLQLCEHFKLTKITLQLCKLK